MAKFIRKLTLPYRSSMKFDVPQDARVIHVDRDPEEIMHAAIWYECDAFPPDKEDEVIPKFWEFLAVYTGDEYWSGAKYLGTVVDSGWAHHVVCLNPGQL